MSKLVYDVWTDGSYREGKTGPLAGAGWVIEVNGTHKENFARLSNIPVKAQPRGSDIAELQAVTKALSMIPHGSVIRLRLDCQNVIDWLKSGEMKGKNTPDYLSNAFADAHRVLSNMGTVEFIKASDRTNSNMKITNNLARTAASKHLM